MHHRKTAKTAMFTNPVNIAAPPKRPPLLAIRSRMRRAGGVARIVRHRSAGKAPAAGPVRIAAPYGPYV